MAVLDNDRLTLRNENAEQYISRALSNSDNGQ